LACSVKKILCETKGFFMNGVMSPTAIHIISIIAGVLVLVYPRMLNYVVAIYLIIVGIMGLVMMS